MSARPIRSKQARKMRKLLQRKQLDRYIDLVQWLRDRGHAQTAGAARKMLTDGLVKSESHVVGRAERHYKKPDHDESFIEYVPSPFVDAKLRSTLRVAA